MLFRVSCCFFGLPARESLHDYRMPEPLGQESVSNSDTVRAVLSSGFMLLVVVHTVRFEADKEIIQIRDNMK